MNYLRPLTAFVAGFSAALVLYGAIYQHFIPRNPVVDPRLAFNLIPLELLFGLIVGVLTWRVFGHKLEKRGSGGQDVRLRMLYRLAHRSGGVVDVNALERTPLDASEALHLLRSLEGQGKARPLGEGRYHLV